MPFSQRKPAGCGSIATRVARGNTEIIASNSIWYGIEVVIAIVGALATSVVIARAIGPDKLGYFSYIMWLANISAAIGSFGIPATTRKYMAEYFGLGQPGVSRAIYEATLRSQLLLAGLITGVGLILVFTVSEREYWWSSAFLVASVLPGMLTAIPAQANEAAENMKANVPSSLLGSLVYMGCVATSVGFGWGLPGIAIGLFLGRVSEVVLRLRQAGRWIATLPLDKVPDPLRVRMKTFLGLSTVLMLLQVIVWDRSDIVLLKTFSGSIREITFFSIAFNLTEKALRFPSAFGGAIGATVLAQFGRDQEALRILVARAARYLFLCGLPVLMGLAVLSGPLVRTFYGPQFLPVIPVLCYAALFAIPKTMLLPAQQLLQASEEQRFLVVWICLCGAINVGLDLLLIPRFGALGATVGNGVGQALGVIGMWARAAAVFRIQVPWRDLTLVAVSGCAMAAAVFGLTAILSGWKVLFLGVVIGSAVFALMLRLFKFVTPDDRQRLLRVTSKTPGPVRTCMERVVLAISE